jgi:biotin carboxylase
LQNDSLLIQVHYSGPLFWGGKENHEWVYDAVERLGLLLAVITDNAPQWLHELVPSDRIAICDLHDLSRLIECARGFETQFYISGFVTYAEEFVLQTAHLAEEFKTPGISLHGARGSSADKREMKKRLLSAGINTPKYLEARSAEEVVAGVSQFDGPAVVKPALGGGSVGVRLIESPGEVLEIFDNVMRLADPKIDPIFRRFDGTFLIEEYAPGRLVSVDGLVVDGVPQVWGMTDTMMGPEPEFLQLGCWTIDIDTHCRRTTEAAISALGFRTGSFHCELRMSPGGPSVIEVACRPPGELITLMYQDAYGIEFLHSLLAISIGRDPASAIKIRNRCSGSVACFPEREGKMIGFEGLDEILSHPNFERLFLSDRIGSRVSDIFNPYSVVQMTSDDHEELWDAIKYAQRTLRITIGD